MSGWAQVHEYRPDESEKFALRGHLYAVISTKDSKEELENVVVGRELLARLHEEYFGSTITSAYNALKNACEKVISEFSEIWGQVQIAAVSVIDEVVYVAAGGGAGISIYREAMLANILESRSPKDKEDKLAVVSASGYPKEGDLLVLGTSSFFETFAGGILKAALERKDPNSAIELLAPTAHSQEGRGDLGAAILKFEKRKTSFEEDTLNAEVIGPPTEEATETKKREKLTSGFQPRLQTLGESIRKNIFSKLSKLPQKRIYVKKDTSELDTIQNRKLAVSIGLILLILLVISIGFGIRQKKIKDEKSRYQPLLQQAKHEYQEATELYSLDPNRARQLLVESKKKVDQLIGEGVADPELNDLSDNISQSQGKILGEYTEEPDLFVDLTLLSDDFQATGMASSEDKLFVFDQEGKKIIRISIDTKKSEVVAGPSEIDTGESIAAYSDRIFLLSGDSIYEIEERKEEVVAGDWAGEVLPYAYAGNLYVLDKASSIIWRYPGVEGGFAAGKNWFSAGVEPDLSRIVSWTIDGTVWLLDDSGKIFKYSLGNQVSFAVSGVAQGFINPKAIYTNEDLNFLYVLDPDSERVVVLTKDGEYKAQYKSEKIKEANKLSVSESEGKMVLLTGDKLYSIELKHLGE